MYSSFSGHSMPCFLHNQFPTLS